MKFQLFKYYKENESIQERDLQLFRLGDHWLFDFNFYRGVFKSYGLDVQFNPMYPMNDLFSIRVHWGRYNVAFGFIQRHFDFDYGSWEEILETDTP
jgi:hypothetical protein